MEILTGKACLQSGLAEHQPAAIDRGETESSGVKQTDLESVIQSEESQKEKKQISYIYAYEYGHIHRCVRTCVYMCLDSYI